MSADIAINNSSQQYIFFKIVQFDEDGNEQYVWTAPVWFQNQPDPVIVTPGPGFNPGGSGTTPSPAAGTADDRTPMDGSVRKGSVQEIEYISCVKAVLRCANALSKLISLRERRRGVEDVSIRGVHELMVHAEWPGS